MDKGYRNHVVSIIVFAILALVMLAYKSIQQTISFGTAAAIIVIGSLVYIALLTIYNFYHTKPNEIKNDYLEIKNDYRELHKRISMTVDTLIRKQQFIEQQTLNLIEEQAQNIWVITTKLENEIKDEGLRRAVEKNLRSGKEYTYFLPHPRHPYFRDIENNMDIYKTFDFYDAVQTNIRFIRLPIETQFLLEEVVIYNPEKPESKDDISGINGFTYYEGKDDKSERTLHMKIEGYLLMFLCRQLRDYLRDKGLMFAAERVITESKDELTDGQRLYLAGLMNKRTIGDDAEYDQFIKSFSNQTSSVLIDRILEEYKEKK